MSRFIHVLQVQLERLDVTNNDLSGLPAELGALRDVKAIVLDGNPMRKIRRDIITKGTMAIMNHLRNQVDGRDCFLALHRAETIFSHPPPWYQAWPRSPLPPNCPPVACPHQKYRYPLHPPHPPSHPPSFLAFPHPRGTSARQLAPDDGPGSSAAAEQHQYEAQAVTNQAKYGKTFSFTGKKAAEVPGDLLASIEGSEISKVELSKNALVAIPAQIFAFSQTLVELDVSFNRCAGGVPVFCRRCLTGVAHYVATSSSPRDPHV